MPRNDGKDVYSYYPILAELTLTRLRELEGLAAAPPFWHRLCAFTHAGLLVSFMNSIDFDSEEMAASIGQSLPRTRFVHDVLALRTEPMWQSHFLSKEHIRADILGRMYLLVADGNFDDSEITRRIREAVEKQQSVSPFLCGPLEGHLRPIDQGDVRKLPDDISHKIERDLSVNGSAIVWHQALNVSLVSWIPADLRARMLNLVSDLVLPDNPSTSRLEPLFALAQVAAIHRDEEMSGAIAERCIHEASESSESAANLFFLMLLASCAIPADSWKSWLSDRLYSLAHGIPTGTPTNILSSLVQDLQKQLPIENWSLGQIEALCTAASIPL